MVEGLEDFANDLANGVEIRSKYNVHNVKLPDETQEFTPDTALKARQALSASQPVFGAFLGHSASTIKSWEQGVSVPNKAARLIFRFIQRDPGYWRALFEEEMKVGIERSPVAKTKQRKPSTTQKKRSTTPKSHSKTTVTKTAKRQRKLETT